MPVKQQVIIGIIIPGKLRYVNARLQRLLNQATFKFFRKVGASLLFIKKRERIEGEAPPPSSNIYPYDDVHYLKMMDANFQLVGNIHQTSVAGRLLVCWLSQWKSQRRIALH